LQDDPGRGVILAVSREAAGDTSDDAFSPMITRKLQVVMWWIVDAIEERTVETDRQEQPGRPNNQTRYLEEISTRCFLVNECVFSGRSRTPEPTLTAERWFLSV
jgi:hypothetical protein